MVHRYTEEEISFLKEIAPGNSYIDITNMFNEHFSLNMSLKSISSTLKRYKIYNGRDCRFQPGCESFNKGVPMAIWATEESIKRIKATQFKKDKKGQKRGHDRKPGDERVTKDGYIEVRMDRPVRTYSYDDHIASHCWRFKHVLVWESVHGPVPKGHKIMFLDGNIRNFDIDNLVLISSAELAVMNKLGYRFKDHPDLTQIGLDLIRIQLKIREEKKNAK